MNGALVVTVFKISITCTLAFTLVRVHSSVQSPSPPLAAARRPYTWTEHCVTLRYEAGGYKHRLHDHFRNILWSKRKVGVCHNICTSPHAPNTGALYGKWVKSISTRVSTDGRPKATTTAYLCICVLMPYIELIRHPTHSNRTPTCGSSRENEKSQIRQTWTRPNHISFHCGDT